MGERVGIPATSEADAAPVVEGQARPSPSGSRSPAEVLALQRAAGNRATVAHLQRAAVARDVSDVGGEKLQTGLIAGWLERAEADRIIKKLSTNYGIAIDSTKAIDAVKAGYPHAPQAVRDSVKTRRWELFELRAVEKAADSFKPILGKMRATSTRASTPQEVVRIGKLDQAIDTDTASGALDTSTVGEYFSGDKTLALFTAGERYGGIFGSDYKKKREMTAHHEMAHGLVDYALPGFVAALDYWRDRRTKSGVAGAEAPPTSYGKTNAGEDFAESVALYFVDRERLRTGDGSTNGTDGNACPKRLAYIKAVVEGWTPPPAPVVPAATATASGGGVAVAAPPVTQPAAKTAAPAKKRHWYDPTTWF